MGVQCLTTVALNGCGNICHKYDPQHQWITEVSRNLGVIPSYSLHHNLHFDTSLIIGTIYIPVPLFVPLHHIPVPLLVLEILLHVQSFNRFCHLWKLNL
jgi:hypothetical protein